MIRTIQLTQGKVAVVDCRDYKFLMQWQWFYLKAYKGGYAARSNGLNQRKVYMHRAIAERMGLVGRIDHENRNKLDNRRRNLRLATFSQNNANCGRRRNNTSGYKGVYWNKKTKKWQARIECEGRCLHLKYWTTKAAAARAYDRAALKHFCEFAVLNFPVGGRA